MSKNHLIDSEIWHCTTVVGIRYTYIYDNNNNNG